jgi:dihydrolipoamide dehydrogenase
VFAVAIGLETTEQELLDTIFPHPTVSEAMQESVMLAFDRPLHL